MDLGISSPQIDNAERGFSFQLDSLLDMRMNQNQKLTAADIVNEYDYDELVKLLYEYGEEKFSKKIVKTIIKYREEREKISRTKELANLINQAVPKFDSNKNPATKTFQALRIYVNDELNELSKALEKSLNLLKVTGKIIIVSFHSLEDRLVKDFFNHNSGKRWRSSRHYPELADDGPITLKLITKKPIRPSDLETKNNPRSRSAKLRVAEKISIN